MAALARAFSGHATAMTKPFIPHVLRVLTASAARDPSAERGAVVNFAVDAHYYTFVMDRTALHRLSRQIERVLREIPPPSRKVRRLQLGVDALRLPRASAR